MPFSITIPQKALGESKNKKNRSYIKNLSHNQKLPSLQISKEHVDPCSPSSP